jgi:tetratricopeptide (TPR) repeat protein
VAPPVTPPPPPAAAPAAAPAPPTPAVAQPAQRELAQAHRARADQLRKEGKLDDAAQAYRQAIEMDRANLELYNELGSTLFALKRFGEAAAAFQESVGRDARFALGWYNLAHALRKADRRGEAATAYRKYMALKPDDPDPYYGLAQTLKGLGDIPGAIAAFRRYIEMEKRPDEQRWVEKARGELQALEASPGAKGSSPSGDAGKGREPHKLRDSLEPRVDGRGDTGRAALERRELRNPFGDLWHGDELLDPFDGIPEPPDLELAGADAKRKLRAYGAALAAYRRALSKHIEEIEARYERGSQLVWNGSEPRAALRAWNAIALVDPEVDAARRNLERVRASFAQR